MRTSRTATTRTSTTRDRALRAAVDEVAEHGVHGLTHARVDARAGLPKGSTSNSFRTRAALVAGLVAHIAEGERADAGGSGAPERTDDPPADVTTPEQLVDLLCALIETETGPHAGRTRARLALSLEVAGDPDLAAPLHRQRAAFVTWTATLLRQVGAADPEAAARTVLACGNGLVFQRLTVDPEVEVRPVVERCVRACLA
ncbi:TetR/AcrR family transcriptional regulator [Janibacter sp. G1551]|uniref:TetR/AcrR family transcriptional regulator n=1 Tax=Janibacter sp. G1551 TaxID=3420440 RepID=UPI003D07E842